MKFIFILFLPFTNNLLLEITLNLKWVIPERSLIIVINIAYYAESK